MTGLRRRQLLLCFFDLLCQRVLIKRLRQKSFFASLALPFFLICLSKVNVVDAEILEYRVKAAFLYNFAKFTEWPADSFPQNDSVMTFAVIGNSPFEQSLEITTAGKKIGSHAISVKHYATLKDYVGEHSHLLFVATSNLEELTQLSNAPKVVGTLLVTDASISPQYKGIIDFFMDGKNVRFDVNMALAKIAKIEISSEVLKLARSVFTEGN